LRASKNELPKAMDNEDMTMFEAVWGDMHVEHDVFKKRFDVTPFLKGLPKDLDPCPHWGIVVKGQITIMYNGKKEIAKAGDAYYFPPGHTGIFEAGTELWEFSPNDKMQKTMEVVMRNFETMKSKKK